MHACLGGGEGDRQREREGERESNRQIDLTTEKKKWGEESRNRTELKERETSLLLNCYNKKIKLMVEITYYLFRFNLNEHLVISL